MLKAILTYLILVVSDNCFAQKTIEEYKKIVDLDILTEIDTATLKKINCKSYEAKGLNNTTNYAGDYVKDKETSLKNIEWILFFYNYYSKELNYEFHFFRGIDMQGKFMASEATLNKIFSECMLKKNR